MNTAVWQTWLGLTRTPVAISFVSEIPAGIPPAARREAAGCAYWKLAASGEVFYATAEDHLGCPIGAYVLGLALPGETTQELDATLGLMHRLEYLRPEEVAQVPRLGRSWVAVVYAPLDQPVLPPDVVIFLAPARPLMLLLEAVRLAGVPVHLLTGRPACGMIPTAAQIHGAVTNLGCIGNRVYTQIGDDEFYVALPGDCLSAVEQALPRICQANRTLETYHCGRRGRQAV